MENASCDQNAIDQPPQQLATPLASSPDAPFPATSNSSPAHQWPTRVPIPRVNTFNSAIIQPRITRACVSCQKKKTKCDGRKPRCGCCLRLGAVCTYTKSKREHQQLQLRSLEQRLSAYESLLQDIISRSNPESRQGVQDAIHSHFDASPEFFSTLLSANSLFEQHIPSGRPGLSLRRMRQAWESNERGDALTLLQQPPIRITSIQNWTSLVDDDVASHLFSLYFTWENPTWQLVDQTLFVHDLEHWRTRFCSSLLVHTLLFFGCSFSYNLNRITDRREEKVLGEKLYAAIQRLWSREKDTVDLPTAQSSILIGLLCCTFGIDKIGTNYIMRGAELSSQLSLDQENCPYFVCDPDDNPTALSTCQKLVSWAVFDIQALACQVYRKKPVWEQRPAVQLSQEEAALLDEGVEWCPYPFQTPVSQPFFSTASWVRSELVAIVHDIARFSLKFPASVFSDEDWQYGNTLYQRLLDWNRKLPWSVLPRHNNTPHIICLHLYYQTTIVSLCEVFLLNTTSPPTPRTPNSQPHPSPFTPTHTKSLALTQISTLILLYKSHHGYKSIPIVMLHYFCVAAIHSISKLSPHENKWGLVLETAAVGLWHMSLGWGRLCKAFLRTIDLVLKAKKPDPRLVPPKVAAICAQIGGGLWTGLDTEALVADYMVLQVPGDLGVEARAGDGPNVGSRARALQELLVAMEGMDVSFSQRGATE
ncbi:hypothetical protein BDW62DRAFT_16515 [Aspergillus aurantiobrunneus]